MKKFILLLMAMGVGALEPNGADASCKDNDIPETDKIVDYSSRVEGPGYVRINGQLIEPYYETDGDIEDASICSQLCDESLLDGRGHCGSFEYWQKSSGMRTCTLARQYAAYDDQALDAEDVRWVYAPMEKPLQLETEEKQSDPVCDARKEAADKGEKVADSDVLARGVDYPKTIMVSTEVPEISTDPQGRAIPGISSTPRQKPVPPTSPSKPSGEDGVPTPTSSILSPGLRSSEAPSYPDVKILSSPPVDHEKEEGHSPVLPTEHLPVREATPIDNHVQGSTPPLTLSTTRVTAPKSEFKLPSPSTMTPEEKEAIPARETATEGSSSSSPQGSKSSSSLPIESTTHSALPSPSIGSTRPGTAEEPAVPKETAGTTPSPTKPTSTLNDTMAAESSSRSSSKNMSTSTSRSSPALATNFEKPPTETPVTRVPESSPESPNLAVSSASSSVTSPTSTSSPLGTTSSGSSSAGISSTVRESTTSSSSSSSSATRTTEITLQPTTLDVRGTSKQESDTTYTGKLIDSTPLQIDSMPPTGAPKSTPADSSLASTGTSSPVLSSSSITATTTELPTSTSITNKPIVFVGYAKPAGKKRVDIYSNTTESSPVSIDGWTEVDTCIFTVAKGCSLSVKQTTEEIMVINFTPNVLTAHPKGITAMWGKCQ